MSKTSTSTLVKEASVAVAPKLSAMRPSRLTIEKIRQFARVYVSASIGGIVLN